MNIMNTLSQEERIKLAKAQALQIRREKWMEVLAALPQPKTEMVEFPYATLDEALDDGFRAMPGGSEGFVKLAKEAWKTRQWRKQAERNRSTRDAAAEIEEVKAELEKVDAELEALDDPEADIVK